MKSYMQITAGDAGLTEDLLAGEVNDTVICKPTVLELLHRGLYRQQFVYCAKPWDWRRRELLWPKVYFP